MTPWTLLLFIFTFVEYNVENLFDTVHDEGKQDTEFLPSSPRHWTPRRYWQNSTTWVRPSWRVATMPAAGVCPTWRC